MPQTTTPAPSHAAMPSAAAPRAAAPLATTFGYYLVFVVLGSVAASLGPTLPDLAANTRSQLSQVSILFLANSAGRIMAALGIARLYDRWPGHPVMAGMLAMLAIMMALIPVTPALGLLALILFGRGLAQGTIDLGGNALLVWVHGARVGPYMNGLHFAFGVGAFLAPVIIAQVVLATGHITWAYWALAATALPAALWIALLPSPSNPALQRGGSGGEANFLLVALIVLFFGLYVGAEVGFGSWLFSYARALQLADATTAAYMTAAYYGTYTIGRLLTIPIAARLSPRLLLDGSLTASLAAMGIVLAGWRSPAATWIGALGLGLGMAAIFPTMFSLAERHMHISGQISGWFFFGGSMGGMALPWLIGQIFEGLGPRAAMTAIFVDLALTAVVFGLLTLAARARATAASQISG